MQTSHLLRFVTIPTVVLILLFVASNARGAEPSSVDLGIADDPIANTDPGAGRDQQCDRFWLISTRRLTMEAGRANLRCPSFSVSRVSCNGRTSRATLNQYLESIGNGRRTVVYVHGNRIAANQATERALAVYRRTRKCGNSGPIDWVIWSWPSEKAGFLVRDFRRKADRTDAQGLYMSWMLRKHVESNAPTTLIGYSFGAPVITGALHALAGGKLGGRCLPGPAISGIPFDAGFVAPAIESHSLTSHGEYSLATKNLDRLLLLYNRRDAVLKRYWLIDRVRGTMALGYSGPTAFAPRADGSKLSLRARDCSPSVGKHHVELDYYQASCRAGSEMAVLIDDIDITH